MLRIKSAWRKYLLGFLALLGIHQHLSAQQKQDLANAGLYTAPWPVAAGGFKIAGIGAADILAGLSIILIAVQLGHVIWKWRRDYKQAEREDEREENP